MNLYSNARNTIADFLSEFVCGNEDFGFCNTCPELRWCDDTGCYDCPSGLDVAACEYYPQQEIDELTDRIIATFETARP